MSPPGTKFKQLPEEPMKKSNISFLLLLVFVAGLYVFQNKAVTPFVLKMVNSALLVEETDDGRQPGVVDTDKTRLALAHCNTYLEENYDFDDSTQISETEHSAWALGDYSYVVRSRFDLLSPSEVEKDKTYICKIKFFGGDDAEYENWTVSGFDYE
jgi:hypothetical protein